MQTTVPQLRPYQQAGVDELISKLTTNRSHGALLADSMGLGKTPTAIEVANRLSPASCLIICPASLELNWGYELERWSRLPYKPEVRSYGHVANGHQEKTEYDLIIFDECHYMKNPEAKRSKACLALSSNYKLFLSGTPLTSRPMDLYPVLHALGLKLSRVQFGLRYCGGHLMRVPMKGGGFRKAWDFSGASHMDELNSALRANVMVRRTKEEVLTELPPKIRQVIAMNFASGESEEFRKRFASLSEAADLLKEVGRIPFSEIVEERHRIAQAKLPYVLKFIDDLLEEEDKIVVFGYHRDIVQTIADAGPNRVALLGGLTNAQKDAAVQAFQHGPARVFSGQITAAGVGLTLTAARTVVFAESDWTPGNILQAEDRCHRIGQRDTVQVFHIVAEGSVDARLVRKVVEKQRVIEEVLA